eukprot:jgi/Chlat1/1235/Chrsp115S01659
MCYKQYLDELQECSALHSLATVAQELVAPLLSQEGDAAGTNSESEDEVQSPLKKRKVQTDKAPDCPSGSRYQAKYARLTIGVFSSAEAAARAYDIAALCFNGEEAGHYTNNQASSYTKTEIEDWRLTYGKVLEQKQAESSKSAAYPARHQQLASTSHGRKQQLQKQPHNVMRGISKEPGGRWEAYIYRARKKIFLGNWKAKEDAAHAYDRAKINEAGRHAAADWLNFPLSTYEDELAQLEATRLDDLVIALREQAKQGLGPSGTSSQLTGLPIQHYTIGTMSADATAAPSQTDKSLKPTTKTAQRSARNTPSDTHPRWCTFSQTPKRVTRSQTRAVQSEPADVTVTAKKKRDMLPRPSRYCHDDDNGDDDDNANNNNNNNGSQLSCMSEDDGTASQASVESPEKARAPPPQAPSKHDDTPEHRLLQKAAALYAACAAAFPQSPSKYTELILAKAAHEVAKLEAMTASPPRRTPLPPLVDTAVRLNHPSNNLEDSSSLLLQTPAQHATSSLIIEAARPASIPLAGQSVLRPVAQRLTPAIAWLMRSPPQREPNAWMNTRAHAEFDFPFPGSSAFQPLLASAYSLTNAGSLQAPPLGASFLAEPTASATSLPLETLLEQTDPFFFGVTPSSQLLPMVTAPEPLPGQQRQC